MAQLFVGQLPFNKFFPEDLLRIFCPYGTVIGHELYIRNGNGFVTYATTSEADTAIHHLHDKMIVPGRHQSLQVMYSKGSKLISTFGLEHRAACLAIKAAAAASKSQQTSSANHSVHSTSSANQHRIPKASLMETVSSTASSDTGLSYNLSSTTSTSAMFSHTPHPFPPAATFMIPVTTVGSQPMMSGQVGTPQLLNYPPPSAPANSAPIGAPLQYYVLQVMPNNMNSNDVNIHPHSGMMAATAPLPQHPSMILSPPNPGMLLPSQLNNAFSYLPAGIFCDPCNGLSLPMSGLQVS